MLPLIRNPRMLSHVAAASTALALAIGVFWGADDLLNEIVRPVSSTASIKGNYLPNLGPDWGTP